jgi:putative chitinase
MLSAEQLQSIMPRITAARKAECLSCVQAAMAEFGIERPARAAAFLAQLAHESGQFRFMEEIWGPTDAQKRYEPPSALADKLGNTQPGDGRRFKGRGPIQITGRANYSRFGGLLGVDLVAEPARAAEAALAFRIAGLFWSKKGLNELADLVTDEAFTEITRRINGGFNGLADRRAFYETARTVLGVVPPPVTRSGSRGAPARVTRTSEEPEFDRGAEAIRRTARRPARRKRASTTRTKSSSPSKSAKPPRARSAKRSTNRRVKTPARKR